MSWKLTKKLKETHISLPGTGNRDKDKDKSKSSNRDTSGTLSNQTPAATISSSNAATSPLSSSKSDISIAHPASSQDNGPATASSNVSTKTGPAILTVVIHSGHRISLPDLPEEDISAEYDRRGRPLGETLDVAQFKLNTQEKLRRASSYRPYLVVEYDKNQIVVEATSGSFEDPVWEKTASFDISKAVEPISIQAYVRTGSTYKRSDDIFLGFASLSAEQICAKPEIDEWIPFSSNNGSIHISAKLQTASVEPLSIEQFELLKVIGKGSFGKVMQVRKKDTNRIYALKTIRKAHVVSKSEVTHTLAERTVLAQVRNPFIVPLKFSFQSPEKLYLVLPFINGGELFHHLQKEGRFSLNRSRFYTAELLSALECLHSFNVIYRDLKPENILLDFTGHIALCDFGLCKLNMAERDKTNTFCGTPEYLAPELLVGRGYTKVVDWWTLGVLLYEMLTGLPPFYDENTNVMYRKILQDVLLFPSDMDKDATVILTGLLTRDPSRRLGVNGSAEIKAHAFFKNIDWDKLNAKKYPAPYQPSVESALDTSNFDEVFTEEVPADSVANDYLSDSVQQQFGGWTYNGSRLNS
ncbi:hypothetical protein CANCADRAFT_30275 [Tortispora caseinolytica NRRL Y-17796]|uniref:non-specific serine/threonine protein kinase n=1 Tax=Tortispora caseinolytica NRRL Y-17796 TaxID=767744 RepID=A0A1E4TJS7_9ASCO|nr:hypothetical protein CANCADRAFT_30275 [Tortispora caseinolytica NRRL Y-17796]